MTLPFFRNAQPLEVLTLMRNLSITLKAGVPLVRALKLFEEDTPKHRRAVLTHLRRSTEMGNSLADALESSPKKFPPIVVNLVGTGELSGKLQESIDDIVKHLKKSQELKRKIRAAMMYPTFVFVAILGLGLSVGILVLPELIPLFESLDVELPLMTRLLLWMAGFFAEFGHLVMIGVILLVILLFIILRIESMKPAIHRFFLMIPYVRTIQKHVAVAQIAGTMETLLRSGIPIAEAIPAVADATSNLVFRRALLQTIPIIESGHTFAQGLRASGKLFPEMTSTLIDIGEETGTLTETLAYLEEFYEGEVDYAVKNLTTALEPILLIGIGIIVGGTVLAIITPIYDVTGSIQ